MKFFNNVKLVSIFILVLAMIFIATSVARATPSAQALYQETKIGDLWQYEYFLYNTSDPIVDSGINIFYFSLSFEPSVLITGINYPSNWDFVSNENPPSSGNYYGFVDWFSLSEDSDIAPGSFLNGFVFSSNIQLASLNFDVYLTNPDGEPYLYSGTTAPVPEPSTIILLGSGLAGLACWRNRRILGKVK